MTLNGVITVILPISVHLGVNYVKVVECIPAQLRYTCKCSPRNLVFGITVIFSETNEKECVKERRYSHSKLRK